MKTLIVALLLAVGFLASVGDAEARGCRRGGRFGIRHHQRERGRLLGHLRGGCSSCR